MWLNGRENNRYSREGEESLSFLSHSLHYGGAVFEGIRFYEIPGGVGRSVFRLGDHINRLLSSAQAVGMECPYSAEELCEAVLETVRQSGLQAGYIRPAIFRGEGIGLMAPSISVYTMVAVMPWAEGPKSVSLATSKLIRLHPNSTNINAKISGHYVNSYMATMEAKKLGADDALLLDYEGNVAEASVANVFFVKGKKIFTPKKGNIFAGLTRDSVIDIFDARSVPLALGNYPGYQGTVEEREVSLVEAMDADAMFLAGTACEVLPVSSLDGKVFDVNNHDMKYARKSYKDLVERLFQYDRPSWFTVLEPASWVQNS